MNYVKSYSYFENNYISYYFISKLQYNVTSLSDLAKTNIYCQFFEFCMLTIY